uniref:Ig-like domain-containing protein n=1 Tax=Acanthochromis polyacanthus TaxID=80966 RepID=A0A3Q1EG43_9TELE
TDNTWKWKIKSIKLSILSVLCFSSSGVKNIAVEPGQNVTLPCKVPNNRKTITAVKWIRPELGEGYVLFYRDGLLDPEYQHPSYENRVDLQDKEMKDGNFSLVLMNVTMEDSGTYECQVFQKGTKRRKRLIAKPETMSIINLDVHPSNDHAELEISSQASQNVMSVTKL